MQQDEVIAELKEYARTEPIPRDSKKVEQVIEYLSALNLFFEQGLLGDKVRVFDPSGRTIQRMERGFQFYSKWMDQLIQKGMHVYKFLFITCLIFTTIGVFKDKVDDKQFLAWQVCYFMCVLLPLCH